jgi:hypothetical protein
MLSRVFLLLLSALSVCSSLDYAAVCDSVRFRPQHESEIVVHYAFTSLPQAFCRIIDASYKDINSLKSSVLEGSPVPKLGKRADEICNSVSFFVL